VSARLARLALALYPLAYRRRYGEEIEALVEDAGASPRAVADLARGAVRAHLRPEPALAEALDRGDRIRLGVSAVLFCWVLFAVAGLALYKTTEGSSFAGTAAPGLLAGVHLAIQILAGLGSLAVVIGAAPLVVAALRQGRERPEARRAARLACASVALFAGASGALVAIANAGLGLASGVEALILTAWALLAVAAGLGCVLAARRGLFAIRVPSAALRFAAACAAVAAPAMGGIVVLLAVYLVDLLVVAPDLAGEPNGPLGGPSVAVSLGIALAAMAALTLPAGRCAWRGAAAAYGRAGTRG
jgi:hypothetical protein